MKKRTIVATIGVLAILATCIFALVACKPGPPAFVDTTKLEVKMHGDYYVGNSTYNGNEVVNTLDLSKSKAFEGATLALTGEGATLNGTVLTVTNSTGNATLKATKGEVTDTHKLFFVNGINTFTYAETEKAIAAGKNAVLHTEITATADSKTMDFKSNTGLYGNGNVINAEKLAAPADLTNKKSWGTSVLVAKGENVIMRDFQIFGLDLRKKTADELAKFDIVNLERYGALVVYSGDKTNKISGNITNVVIENGHKVVEISGSTVVMEGCIVKNASDSLISIGASDNGGTNLTMKNNVLMTAVVAGIVMYGWTDTKDFCNLTVEGFLDIYNWKESNTAKIMPTTEQFNELANGLVSKELEKEKNAKYVYAIGNLKYVHTGIVVISTGKLASNKAKIDGTIIDNVVDKKKSVLLNGNTDSYVIRAFPVPDFASLVLKTSCLVGYGNKAESKNAQIGPETKLTEGIYNELRNGRK